MPLTLFNIITGLLAIASAFCWYRSSTVSVNHEELAGEADGAYRDGTVVQDGNDFFATNKLQSKWNRWAAGFASLAALAQAIVAGIGAFAIN